MIVEDVATALVADVGVMPGDGFVGDDEVGAFLAAHTQAAEAQRVLPAIRQACQRSYTLDIGRRLRGPPNRRVLPLAAHAKNLIRLR